jgi:chromosome segregation ATPase
MPLLTVVEKAAIRQATTTLKAEADALKQEADNLVAAMTPTAAQAARAVKPKVESLKVKIQQERDKLPLVQADETVQQLTASKLKLQNARHELADKLADNQGWLADAEERVTRARSNADTLARQLKTMETALADKKASASATVEQLKSQQAAYNAANEAVKAAKKNLQSQTKLAAAQTCPSLLTDPKGWWSYKPLDIAPAETQVRSAEANLESTPPLSSEAATLLSDIERRTAKIQETQDRLNSANDDLASRESQAMGNAREIAALRGRIDDANRALDDVNSKLQEATEERDELQKMDTALQAVLTTANSGATTAEGKKNAIDKAYADEAKQRDTAADGHCVKRHGPNITDQKLKDRLTTGVAPDGVLSPTQSACKFSSNQELVETQNAAIARLMVIKGVANLSERDGGGATQVVPRNHGRDVGSGFDGAGATTAVGDLGGVKYAATTPRAPCQSTHTSFEYKDGSWVIAQHYPN